jgi:hypothetical protein
MKRLPSAIAVLVLAGDIAAAQTVANAPADRTLLPERLPFSWHMDINLSLPPVTSGAAQPLTRGALARSWELAFSARAHRRGDVDWLGLFTQQTRVDATMHWLRLFQPKFHDPLYHSVFFKGYAEALKGYFSHPLRWNDGDDFLTNDVGHPIMGAVFTYTFTDHDRRCAKMAYGDAGYWSCITRAAVYATLASANWEWNPLMSESALGHIGKHRTCAHGRCTGEGGWTDLVVTPLGGIGIRIAGDMARSKLWPALDRRMPRNRTSMVLTYTLKTLTAPGHVLNCAFKLDFRGAWKPTAAAERSEMMRQHQRFHSAKREDLHDRAGHR